MNIKIILLLVFVGLLISAVFLYYRFGIDHYCNNLKRIADDDVLVSEVWEKVSSLLKNPLPLTSSGKNQGLVYVRDVPENQGVRLIDICFLRCYPGTHITHNLTQRAKDHGTLTSICDSRAASACDSTR